MQIIPHYGCADAEEALAKYREDGFALFPKMFSDQFVCELAERVELYKNDDRLRYDCSIEHVNMAFWSAKVDRLLDDFRGSGKLLDICSQILGTNDIKQHIQHAFFRDPGNLDCFPWHRDEIFRGPGLNRPRETYVAMAIYLDDITELDQGAIAYIPGSHRNDMCDANALATYDMIQSRPSDRPLASDLFDQCEVLLPQRGMIGVWNAGTIHASPPNRTPRNRRYILHGYARADAVSDPDYHWAWHRGEAVPFHAAVS